jgi:hypothetical protein
MNYKQKAVFGTCIPEEELPARVGLRVERKSDPDYGLSDDEIADRNEFIRCYLVRELELLMMLPGNEEDTDFFIPDCDVTDEAYSAFNTVDFQKSMKPFDKYGYAMKKIMDRVKALAILHSSIGREEGRQNIVRRFDSLIEFEFREPLFSYIDRFKAAKTEEQKERLKRKIGDLNRRILEARKTWERYAPIDV